MSVRTGIAIALLTLAAAGRSDAEEIDWGSLTVEPERMIRMDETPSFRLTYTAERTLGAENSIFIGIPNQFSRPQNDDPDGYGYSVVSSSRGGLVPSLVLGKHKGWGFEGWGWAVEIRWAGAVRRGDEITVDYGLGSGVELGQVAFALVFRCKVRHNFPQEDHYVPDPPPIPLSGTSPVSLIVTAPSTVGVSEPFDVMVVARDRYDNANLEFQGQVHLFGPDLGQAARPYTIAMSPVGANVISGVRIKQPGTHHFAVSGPAGIRGESNPIRVARTDPEQHVYWGELHIHTSYSDGLGTPETAYRYGRDIADIDFMGVTDHAEQVTGEEWREMQRVAKEYNEPGRFVTFLAQEWSGPTDRGGDHNVFHLDDDQPLFRSTEPSAWHVTDLYEQLSKHRAFTIPHVGGRIANLDHYDPVIDRNIEIYSSHGVFEPHTNYALQRGYRLGIVAASDGHDGNAGYSNWLRLRVRQHGGLAAVRATGLTRQAIYQALFERRVYATTGERILLDFSVNGRGMGEAFSTRDTPVLKVEVVGTAPIKRVDLIRNDTCVKTILPETGRSLVLEWSDVAVKPGQHYYMVRVQQDETAHQQRVTLPRNDGISVDNQPWKAFIECPPDSGAPPGPFEVEREWRGGIAWSSPIWVTKQ